MSGSEDGDSDSRALLDVLLAARAVLEDSAGRGLWAEDPALVAAAPDRPMEPSAPVAPAANAAARGWAHLATEARAAGATPAQRLSQVREELGDCRRCGLCKERQQIVFGVGDPDADLLVVGEAPGYHEDQQGEPFVGPAGQMLDKMLENVVGLSRAQVYILNVVKCRPPKNRDPLPEEVLACRPFLDAQFASIRPKVVLLLGSVAYRALFRSADGIKRRRGEWHTYEGVPVMPTFHPAYLLRQPEDKKYTFEDLKKVRAKYDETGGRR